MCSRGWSDRSYRSVLESNSSSKTSLVLAAIPVRAEAQEPPPTATLLSWSHRTLSSIRFSSTLSHMIPSRTSTRSRFRFLTPL
jgi:hypothetical protein